VAKVAEFMGHLTLVSTPPREGWGSTERVEASAIRRLILRRGQTEPGES
jgi:hypothetical protein